MSSRIHLLREMFTYRRWERCVVAFLFSASLLGCGPSSAVMEAQERDTQKAYEEAAKNPPNLPPQIQEKRQWRLQNEFSEESASDNSEEERKP